MDITSYVTRIAYYCARHPWRIFLLAFLISLASLWATTQLPVYTSRQALLPQNTPVAERFNHFLKNFGAASDLMVVLEGAPREQLERYATALAQKLRTEPEIGQVSERLDVRFLLEHGYLPLPSAQLDQFGGFMNTLAATHLPGDSAGLEAALRKAQTALKSPPPMGDTDLQKAQQALDGLAFALEEWQRWLTADTVPEHVDWNRLLSQHGAQGLAEGYFTSRDGKMLFLFVHAKNPSEEFADLAPFVEKVKADAATLVTDAKAAGQTPPTVGLTGLPAIQYEEYFAIQKDITLVISSAAVLIAVLILGVVRSVRWALAIFIPMGLGALWTLGLAWLTVGHLTIITSGFLAILFGLGADYGIFTSSRIAEERRAGKPLLEAIASGIASSFTAVLTAGGASVFIFAALATVEFPGFAELGRVAGGGVFLILIATWMVQPALYALFPPKLAPVAVSPTGQGLHAKLGGRFPRSVAVVLVVLGLAGAVWGGIQGFKMPFDYDALALLPKESQAAYYQKRMVAESDYQAEVVIFTARDMPTARRIAEAAAQLKTIAQVRSPAELFPPDAEERARKARDIAETAARAGYAAKVAGLEQAGLSAANFALVRGILAQSLASIDDFQEQAFSSGHGDLVKGLERVRGVIEALNTAFEQDPERGRQRSELFFRTLLHTAGHGLAILDTWRSAEPLTPERLPPSLRDRFFAQDGSIAIYAFPAQSVYDPGNLERLTEDAYRVSPEATGFPITHLEFSRSVVASFTYGTGLAAVVCLVWLALILRDGRAFILATLPLLMGGGWMLGIMALAGIPYNYANIVALPLVMALAVDYGVWFAHRWRELKDHSPLQISLIAGKVIALAAGTELAGLGAITLASYRGVSGLGVAITIGLLCCLPATLWVAPAIGQLIDPRSKA